MKLKNLPLINLIVFLLFTVFASQVLATVPKNGEESNKKLNSSFFNNEIMSGAGIAKVFGTDKGKSVKFDNPYTNQELNVFAGTFKGEVDGDDAHFYCIDIQHGIGFYTNQHPHKYTDNGPTSDEITYVLNHYYPYKAWPYTGSLSETKEAAAVQLAIWHYADGLDVSSIDSYEIRHRVEDIVEDADANAESFVPLETLNIFPSSQTLPDGDNAQFQVETLDLGGIPLSGLTVDLSTSSGSLSTTSAVTDATGTTQIITLTQGSSQSATITATANVKVPQGTRYVHTVAPDTYQKLVLATPAGVTRTNTAEVTWESFDPNDCDGDGNNDISTFDGFKFEFQGMTNNGNGTSTWTYKVSGDGASKDLSHWVLALCDDHNVIDASFPGKWEVVNDPKTNLYGIKWDKEISKNGGSLTFSFTLDGIYDMDVVDVAFKAGNAAYYCTINGPSCDESQDCENTIGDFIWHDKDVDGIQDSGEEGIEGVVVELLQGNSIIETTTTDANGYYEFTAVPNGSYKVRVAASNYSTGGVLESTNKTKWYASPKNEGGNDALDSDADKNESVTVELNCANNTTIDFGFYKTCVKITKEADVQTAKVGDKITYTFTIENCGDITLSGGVDIYDALINPNGNNKIKNITPVHPGDIKSFTAEYVVTENDCGDLINIAKAVGHPIDGSADVKHSDTVTVAIDCTPVLDPVTPLLECVIDNGNGTYTAYFGYLNSNNVTVTVPVGVDNKFSPAPADRNQPTEFTSGRSDYWPNAAFSVTFNENETLTWTLEGTTVTADKNSEPCSEHIYFNKKWFDSDGNLMDSAPENIPSNYKIEVTSELGTATGQYNSQGQLIFTYSNTSIATDDNGLWVPVNGQYTVNEYNLPNGYSILDGVGTYTSKVPGGYASNPYNSNDDYGLHIVKNQKDDEGDCVEDWSVELGPDSAICEYEPQWITINGSVSLNPNPSTAKLQLSWRVVYPNRPDVDNSTHYESIWITKDTNFTITAWWPGITAQDSLVEIHYGVNVLDCDGNPIKNGVGKDLYWYPWVCDPPVEEDVDIEVEKSASNYNPSDGDQVTYTITASNNGPADATGVQVTDILPDGVTFISASTTAGTYDENTGIWNVGAIANGDYKTLDITVEIDAVAMNNATFDLGQAKDYNLFVFYDAAPSSDTEGRVAVGRDASFGSGYSIGDKLPANSGNVLVVGRDLTFTSGRIYNGNAVYGNSTNLPLSAVSIDGQLINDNPINFASAITYLENLSTTLAGYNVSGTTTYQWTGLTLEGSDPYLNVFEVNGADLTASTSMAINVPNGSAVLVNISGDDISWSGGLTVTGTAISNVLYNFYEAENMTISGIDVRGSILAPFTHVNFVAGVQNGQMICKSLEGAGQFNNTCFVGNIPVRSITNIATLTSVIEQETNSGNNSGSATVAVNGNGTEPGTGSSGGSSEGETWEVVDNFLEGQIVWAMTHAADGSVLVGTWGGAVYQSNVSGADFSRINNDMTVGFIWSLLVKDDYFFAGTEQGIYRYDGSEWTKLGLDGKDVRALAEANGKIYAGVWGGGIYVSSNNGATWASITTNGILEYGAIQDIAVSVDGKIYAATLGQGVCVSNDGGESWTKLNVGYDYIWSIGITSGNVIFAGTYGSGLYASNDAGATWYKVDLDALYIYDITMDASDNVYLSTLLGGVYVTSNNGATFEGEGMSGFGVSSILTTGEGEDATLMVGTSDGSIYKKVDGSVTDVEGEEEEIPTEFRLDQNYPNPFNPSTTIQFAIPEAGNYKLIVYNILGERVTTLVNSELAAGTHKIVFNAGRYASGIYIYQLVGKNLNMTKKMVLLK